MRPYTRTVAAALALAACLAWLSAAAWAASPPSSEEPSRWRTPLGTFELDPGVRQRLEALEKNLREAASELRDLLRERVTLSPEQRQRLQELMDRLRDQLKRLEEPQEEGGPKKV